MKKINLLVYKNKEDLNPVGGPNGYVYNLNLGLEKLKQSEIVINFLESHNNKNTEEKIKKIASKLPKKIFRYLWNLWMKKYYYSIINSNGINTTVDFSKYDLIHFHSTLDLFLARNSLKNYSGKIILTSHSPKPFHQELMDSLNIKNEKMLKSIHKSLEEVDIYSFNRADYIVFPCEEAEEPYYNQWKMYEKIKEENKNKYNYLITGIKKCSSKISKKEIRRKYGIPDNAFLISYVGRHNNVKGYDLLKEIGSEVLLKDKNIYIICAGTEGPIYRLESENWIETGWTNDPYSIVGASNLFVLPNRETYFDLVLLEVLSLGIPALISYTGGNKYFKQFNSKGIWFFKSTKDASNEILNLSKKSKAEMLEYSKLIVSLFDSKFTEICFAKNYISLVKKIDNK